MSTEPPSEHPTNPPFWQWALFTMAIVFSSHCGIAFGELTGGEYLELGSTQTVRTEPATEKNVPKGVIVMQEGQATFATALGDGRLLWGPDYSKEDETTQARVFVLGTGPEREWSINLAMGRTYAFHAVGMKTIVVELPEGVWFETCNAKVIFHSFDDVERMTNRFSGLTTELNVTCLH